MSEYLQFKRKIEQRVEILEETIQELEKLKLVEDETAARWRIHLDHVRTSLEDQLLRVAVVGAVKSGKSTLINALAGTDLLKRGAGIITAFITRIVSNGAPGCWVELKPWAEVLDEINSVSRMLPVYREEAGGKDALDIRSQEDRALLARVLDKMQAESRQVRSGCLDVHFLLLKAYLDGYDTLHHRVGEEINRLEFDEGCLDEHQKYVGFESRSVYTRDMEIHYPLPWAGGRIEIADCQGSDSPNPLHYQLIQQYLLGCHFIIYVIGSRTGLREADFKLLDFIRTLRMFPQTFFVLNADLGVHNSREDLDALEERVRSELCWLVPNPRLFTFSALYHLTDQAGDSAAERERRHLDIWKEDDALARATEEGFAAFKDHLEQRISGQRTRILLGSGLSRLSMVAANVLDTARAQERFLDENLESLRDSAGRLQSRHNSLRGMLGTLANAVSGINETLRRELDEAVDEYFDIEDGRIVQDTMKMLENYPVDSAYLKDLADTRQVVRSLYLFYLEFRQSLSRYLVERVNLRVIEFAREQEAFLNERLAHSSRALWSLFSTAVGDYRRELASFQIHIQEPVEETEQDWPVLNAVRPPTFSAFLDQGAIGRGMLLMKFGLGRVSRFLSALRSGREKQKEILTREVQNAETMEEAVLLVKAQTGRELLRTFQEYRNNFKYGYLHRILNEATLRLLEDFKARADMTQVDFESLMKRSDAEGEERKAVIESLTRVGQIAEAMVEELGELRYAINLGWLSQEGTASRQAEKP